MISLGFFSILLIKREETVTKLNDRSIKYPIGYCNYTMNLQLIVNKGVVANVEDNRVEQYRQNAVQVAGLNMSMDSGYGNIAKKKDIRRDMISGYMSMLSNQVK